MFVRGALTLLRIRGIPIRAHWTLLLVLPYVAWVFSAAFAQIAELAGVAPDAVTLPPLLWGALVAVGLFASVAVHEMAHSLVALRLGGRVRDVTLMLLGGVSRIERMPRRPRTEALVSAAGPLVSLVLGALLIFGQKLIGDRGTDLRLGLFYLGYLNLVLGVFNLLPAFPMDGGRVLRAGLSAKLGPRRATSVAAGVGTVAAVAFAILGFLGGNVLLILIALFIFFGAQGESRAERLRDALRDVHAGDLILGPLATATLDTPVADVLPMMRRSGRADVLVVDGEGRPAGVVRAGDLAGIPGTRQEFMTVAELGDRIVERAALRVRADEAAGDVLDRVGETGADYVVVVGPDGAARGLVSMRDLVENVAVLRSAGESRPPQPRHA